MSSETQSKCDNMDLPGGHKMPLVGLGTWQATNDQEIGRAVDAALAAGYRHFDTAYLYTNEKAIGRVFTNWINSGRLKREELFVVTKLPMIGNTPDKVSHFVSRSLEALNLNYIDLYLIHGPIGFQYVSDTDLWPRGKDGALLLDMTTHLESVWQAMEEEVESGRIKSIGVSNFSPKQIERIVNIAKVPLSNIQVECHIYFQQKKLREVCTKFGITVCAYAPLGSMGREAIYASRGQKFEVANPLDDQIVKDIAKKHGKTPAQILLRFLVQQGIAVIPKSTNADRLKQNIDVFDFQLGTVEMRRLDSLDKDEKGRTFTMKAFPGAEKHPESEFYVGSARKV